MRYVYCIVIFSLLACSSVTKTDGGEAHRLMDVSYGPDPANKLDLYMPATVNDATEIIVLIHGGAWAHGDKSQFYSTYAENLAAQNFVVANINYRLLSDKIGCKEIMQDVKQVIGFLDAKSNDYSIPRKKVILMGHSAGGHISLLYAHKEDAGAHVKMAVSLAGPTNLNDRGMKYYADSVWDMPFLYPQLIGEEFKQGSPAAINCSPLYHVKRIPTLLVHGSNDAVVPYYQAMQMDSALAAKNAMHLLIRMEGEGHSMTEFYLDSVSRTMVRWLRN